MPRHFGTHRFDGLKIGQQNVQPTLDGYAVKAARTKSSFVMTVDPINGRDPDAYGFVTNQAQSDTWGSFATMVGATRALPDHIMHRVVIQLTDGYHIITDGSVFGDLSRFTFGLNAPSGIDAINDVPSTYGHIAIKSLNGYVRVANTSVYTVSSMPDSATLILNADPGFPSNTFRGCFIRLITGSATGGSGNIWVKAIRSHSGTTFNVAGRFDGGVTTFEIVQPAAVIQLDAITRARIAMQEPWSGNSSARSLVLEEVDLTRLGATGLTFLCNYGNIWLRGCRCLKVAWFGTNTDFEMNNAVVDGLGLRSIMFTVSSGNLSCTSSESSWIVRGATSFGIFAGSTSSKTGCKVFLFKGAIDDNGVTGLVLQGNDTFGNNATTMSGTGNGSYGVEITKGARWEPRLSDFIGVTGYLTGNIADMFVDGVTTISYNDVNAEIDKTIIGAKGSIVSGT